MAAHGVCAGCGRQRVVRRVEMLLHLEGGGVRSVHFRLCGSCTAALLDSVSLHAVGVEMQLEVDQPRSTVRGHH